MDDAPADVGGPFRRIVLVLVLASLASGCGDAPDETRQALQQILAPLEAYGVHPEASDDVLAQLAWQAPATDCPQAYRIHTSYVPVQMHEEDSVSSLAIGRAPPVERLGRAQLEVPEHAPIPAGVVAPLQLYYRGLRAERRGSSRDVFASAQQYGPSAPTAACFPRTWDPMEDALALGWPHLPEHPVLVGERWTGGRVEGKCNRSPCVDPLTGGGGPDQHHRACVSMSWSERLAGVYEIAGERFALVESHWDDGHPGQGISTDRLTLISIEHGRPTWSRTVIDHRFPQPAADRSLQPVVRTWVMESMDACPGGLATLGWQLPEDGLAEVADVIEQLRNSDELRKRESKSKRERDPADADPFASGPPQ
ncbi:MAG: hypothetical protein IAG13_36310 [Deltaproteobacteria bacterium]|nr:hypothetical protein [Nannocystaceae bacterium]